MEDVIMEDVETRPNQRIHLLDLPQEILEAICAQLCHHCTEPTQPGSILWPTPNILREEIPHPELLDVVFVCKQLREAAQPILFHSVRFRADLEPDMDLSDFLSPLVRALGFRKDLRNHVRHIDIDAQNILCSCCPHTFTEPSRETRAAMQNICNDVDLPLAVDSVSGEEMAETLMQMVLAVVPNLTELRLVIPRSWSFALLHSWMRVGMGLSSMRFLPSVKTMLLEIDELDYEACTQSHLRCSRPCPVSPVEKMLVDAAPNVQVLSCTASGLESLPMRPNLTHLQLWMRGSWEQKLEKLMRGLPALTHLAYWSNNQHCPSPKDVQQALEPQKGTLEMLSISLSKRLMDAGKFNRWEQWVPPKTHEWVLDPFSEFPRLKSLTLDDHMIWRNSSGHPAGDHRDTRISRDLKTFLPPSLEFMFVFNSMGTELPVFPLAQSIKDGTRRDLRRVIWAEFDIEGFFIVDQVESQAEQWLQDKNWKRESDAVVSDVITNALHMPFVAWDSM